MGSDDLHHKRKKDANRLLARARGKREQYDYVLIVCEGEKTEPYYLDEFCEHFQLNSANIKVVGLGADPLSLVKYALEEFEKNPDYDRIYCVFDKDQHVNYRAALQKIDTSRTKKKNPAPIFAITSVPCFEFWILLHFENTSRPYVKVGNKSAGTQVKTAIKKYISDYAEGKENIFSLTKDRLDEAIRRAKVIDNQQKTNGTDNPSTKIHQLIEYLMNIRKHEKKR